MADAWGEKVLKTVREREWKEGKTFGIWVVQKYKDGRSYGVTVRAGMARPDKVTGEKVLPKDGLSLEDFEAIGGIYKTEILPLLQIPKGSPVEMPPAQEPDQEAPPW